jgi:ribonuclease-3
MSKEAPKSLAALEAKLDVEFKDPQLLRQALVHRSYLNEHPSFSLGHNERLEFLGDAVLELIVTDHLYRHYPNPEGDLTNWRSSLVNADMLATLAEELDVERYLYLSRGESRDRSTKARRVILANTFESLVGAMYMDQGLPTTKKFITRVVIAQLEGVLRTGKNRDPKSTFQERAQEKHGLTPRYEVLHATGPDHSKHFTVGVYLGTKMVAKGTGSSKQEAQVAAAAAALKASGW